MAIGPIQLLAIGFKSPDFKGEILDEIENDVIAFAESSPEPDVSEVERYALAEDDPWVKGGVR